MSGIPYVFHLQHRSIDKMDQETTTASVCSTYKQRIDSMFDETRSQSSFYEDREESYKYDLCFLVSDKNTRLPEENSKCYVNPIQVNIEKIFTEMAKTQRKMEDVIQTKHSTCLHESFLRKNSFSVEHLGSVQLLNKVRSLRELQEPLKNLYFDYCRKVKSQQGNRWGKRILEITGNGIKIYDSSVGYGESVQLNTFNNISVWAAVKFVYRKKKVNNEGLESKMEYAFSPLIAGTEAVEKDSMFQELSHSEENMIISALNEDGYKNSLLNQESPMLIIAMRKTGVPRQLECHGFVCACSEDAIVIAANLYQLLIKSIHSKRPVSGSKLWTRKTNNKSTEICEVHKNISVASEKNELLKNKILGNAKKIKSNVSSEKVENVNFSEIQNKSLDSYKTNEIGDSSERSQHTSSEFPIRPPRQNKKLHVFMQNKTKLHLPVQKYSENLMENETKYITEKEKEYIADCADNESLYQAASYSGNIWQKEMYDHKNATTKLGNTYGDVLTKIAIPHSKSFLNANGPFTRYFRQQNSGENFSICNRDTIIRPLGLHELFTEFSMQEGLESMDDILDTIIDAEGMSFNDLKPLHKEFLFKLAVTLTKDELYQRSKFIMRRQKKKRERRKSCCKNKKFPSGRDGLHRVFRHSFSKFRNAKSKLTNSEFTSVLFPSESTHTDKITYLLKQPKSSVCSRANTHRSTTRSSEKGTRNMFILPRHGENSQMSGYDSFCVMPPRARVTQTNLTEKLNTNTEGINRSSSGYISCSDCSYDSESCTCSSVEKCFCSRHHEEEYETPSSSENKQLPSECTCDTDSCFRSDKCYCTGSKKLNEYNLHPNTKMILTKCIPPKQANVLHKHQFINYVCGEIPMPVPNDVPKSCLALTGFTNKSIMETDWCSGVAVTRKPNTRNLCYKCLGFNSKNTSYSLNPSARTHQFNERNDRKYPKNRINVYACVSDGFQKTFLNEENTPGNSENTAEKSKLLENLNTQNERSISFAKQIQPEQQKMLVVSARDQLGRVVYMGATSRNGKYKTPEDKFKGQEKNQCSKKEKCENLRRPPSTCEALSVKKTAEIAALFSDIKSGWPMDKLAENEPYKVKENNLASKPEPTSTNFSSGINYSLSSDLENSLGYFP